MADDLKAVREIYKTAIPEAFKSVVKEHGGKTFSKEQRLPKPLILAAIPKEKENKDLSMKTLIKGIKDLKQYMDHKKGHEPHRVTHSSQILVSDDHIVLQRVIGGKEEVLEMTFRRAGKVDIHINGKAKPEGSLWNDDALATATAFLKGKDLFFHKRVAENVVPKESVICQKRSLLAGK